MRTKIYKIISIELNILKTKPPTLEILANGKTNTSGWSNPELVARQYKKEPDDGIYDYDFVAKKPEDISADVITPIDIKEITRRIPQIGVRIHAESNSLEKRL
ncbi:MAG: hypothetical protein WAT71_07685 [Ignavibacteria bacterium]